MEIEGIVGKALLYFDSLNHVYLRNELTGRLNRLKSELATLKRYPKSKLKRYEPYFIIAKHEHDVGFDYVADVERVEKIRKTKGYFFIFTTYAEASPEDILYRYRAKDVSEKIFSQIKCDM